MKECIILAGGFGTRLQSVVKDIPKCMAPVAGKPFLFHLLKYAESQDIQHIVLSLGYKHDTITKWLGENSFNLKISFVIENEPLGTGGAIKYAFSKIEGDSSLIINGDTFFNINIEEFIKFHKSCKANISLALKPMYEFDRYGSVEVNEEYRIIKFNEKQFCEKGFINGGVYAINKEIFDRIDVPQKFSFETDILEKHINALAIFGSVQDDYFIDIGIPSDYEKANLDFAKGLI